MNKCKNTIPFFTKYVKLPILRTLGRKFYIYYKELKKTQYYSLKKLENLQFKKFKKLLDIAYNNVDFYKELYDSKNINPSDIKSINDITKLPIITKSDLKKAYPDQTINKSIKNKKIILNSTSGSTGKPFEFALDNYKKDRIEALKMRNFEFIGYGYGRKYYSLWGFSPADKLISKLYKKFILKRSLLDCTNLNDETKEKYSRILLNNPHTYLEGYASGLVILAKYMKSKGYKAKLCGVTSSAESLLPLHRKLLENVYSANIFNRYGTREFGDIAIECQKHIGLHINMESFIVEIVNKNGEICSTGEKGSIIVTDLDNYVMPFIRYNLEDTSLILDKKCTCGRHSIILSEPEGRIVDTIVTPEGKHLSFGFFVLTFEDSPIIDQFQIIQLNAEELELKIIKNPSFSEEKFKSLLKKVIKYCAPMKVKVNYVEKIPIEKSGKMRIVKGITKFE